MTRNGTKLPRAILIAGASAAGSVAGLAATWFGMDPAEACKIGMAAGGAAGDLLLQALRTPPEAVRAVEGLPAVPSRTPSAPRPREAAQLRHERHRQLERAAQRFAQRARAHGNEREDRHGAA